MFPPNPTNNAYPQWWDRNCQTNLPEECGRNVKRTIAPHPVVEVQITAVTGLYTTPTLMESDAPATTHVPDRLIRKFATDENNAGMNKIKVKRDPDDPFISLPPYISRLIYPFAPSYLTPVCSCLITSAKVPVSGTTTLRFSTYTATTVSQVHQPLEI